MKTIINKFQNKRIDMVGNLEKELDYVLESGSSLDMLYISCIDEDTKFNFTLFEDTKLNLYFISTNGTSNIDLNVDIKESGANVTIKTLSLAYNSTRTFNQTINHYAPYSNSQIFNDGISFSNGHNIFNVTGFIDKDMTGSDVRQISKGLILASDGSCTAKPILLIDHHDVKAYHGATIGKINDEDLFYLMSRGLTKSEASMLIINGILSPYLSFITDEVLKESVVSSYEKLFEGGLN